MEAVMWLGVASETASALPLITARVWTVLCCLV